MTCAAALRCSPAHVVQTRPSLRAQHFFASTTFSASMSSACCATISFSRFSLIHFNAVRR